MLRSDFSRILLRIALIGAAALSAAIAHASVDDRPDLRARDRGIAAGDVLRSAAAPGLAQGELESLLPPQRRLFPNAPKQDVKRLRRRARAGDVESQIALGHVAFGQKDYSEAAKWFEKAYDQGNLWGQTMLGPPARHRHRRAGG